MSYFGGSLFFTVGAYLGFFEVINVGSASEGTKIKFVALRGSSISGYRGSLAYFLGALLFNVNTSAILFLPAWPHQLGYQWAVPWFSATAASVLFTFAAITEFRHNSKATPREQVWWLCSFYLLGSVLFLIAAASAYPGRDFSRKQEDGLVNATYLAGSVSFFFGAWVALIVDMILC